MRTINAGDVFILHDVFHGRFDTQQLKTLHYAFGTLSGRPVVVIRPPAAWDVFGMVTILPAMSKGNPCYEVPVEDIFGKKVECNHSSYKWMPHYPYSVPVSRLGKYVGSLTITELKEILDAFEWVHNPFKQITKECPEMYKNLCDVAPVSQIEQSIQLNQKFEMQTLDSFNGMVPKVDKKTLNEDFLKMAERHIPKVLAESAEESTVTPEETDILPEEEVFTEVKNEEIPKETHDPEQVKEVEPDREPIEYTVFDKRFSMK